MQKQKKRNRKQKEKLYLWLANNKNFFKNYGLWLTNSAFPNNKI